jgi:hypothetical protein
MMRLATLLLLCLATSAQAAVYRWIDTYGEVQYGDKPPAGVAVEEVELPELSTYAPPPAADPAYTSPAGEGEFAAAEGKVKRYRRLLITQPTDGQTIRSDDGLINVAVDLRPALQEVAGHRLIAVVDGRRIPGGGSRIPVRVPRGSHRLQVAVIDVDGRVVARSRKISFDMRPKTRLPIPAELGGIEGLAPAPAPLPSN